MPSAHEGQPLPLARPSHWSLWEEAGPLAPTEASMGVGVNRGAGQAGSQGCLVPWEHLPTPPACLFAPFSFSSRFLLAPLLCPFLCSSPFPLPAMWFGFCSWPGSRLKSLAWTASVLFED